MSTNIKLLVRRSSSATRSAEARLLSFGWSGRNAQVVALGVRDPEVPQSPGPILEGFENRVSRGRDAVAPPLYVVHLKDDFYP